MRSEPFLTACILPNIGVTIHKYKNKKSEITSLVTGKGKADKIIAEGPGLDDDLILPGWFFLDLTGAREVARLETD